MARKPNPALLGAFVVGAVILAVAGLVILGGGRFFRTTQPWVAYFGESVKGLSIGAPVLFKGVKVGSVTDIKVVLDPQAERAQIPVYFEIDGDRLSVAAGQISQFMKDRAVARRAFELGLRAQLETQSFVTGQLAINIDFFPGTPVRLVGGPQKYPEFPTIPSTLSAIGKRLEEIDVVGLARDAQEVLQGVSRLVSGQEIRTALASANAALVGANRLVATGDARLAALGTALEGTVAKANDTLESVQVVLQRVDTHTVTALNDLLRNADSQTLAAVNETVRDAQKLVRRLDAETVPAANQVLADLRPLLADAQKAVGSARGALEKAETTLGAVDGTLDGGSALGHQLKTTLQELSAAARAFRDLSSYLERHPNSIIFGKNGKQGD
jgi:paraquat-inducible protein B